MAIAGTVVADIVEQPPRCSNTRQGIVAIRSFIVTAITGATSAATLVYDALGISGIPLRGDSYPANATYSCDDIEVEAISPNQARVTCTYRVLSSVTGPPGNSITPLVSCGSSLQQQEVGRNNAGALMKVGYTPSGGTIQYASVTAQKQTPQFIYRVSRRETSAPVAKAMANVGYVNTDTFKTMAAGTVLCSRIEGNSNDEGLSWIVEYEFIYNPQGWLFGGWYVDENNQVPSDAANGGDIYTDGNGYKVFAIYPTVAFSGMGL